MNLFFDLVAVFKGLAEIGPEAFHAIQQMAGAAKLLTVILKQLVIKGPEQRYLVGGTILSVFDGGRQKGVDQGSAADHPALHGFKA